MTGTTDFSIIFNQQIVIENIASHLTDPQDFQNLTQINRGTYISLTQPKIARHIWSQFVGEHHHKIPPSLCIMLSFQPRVHHYEDGSVIDTLNVYEIILSQTIEGRSVMQSRQIPYIDNPTLHLLGQGKKLKEELDYVKSQNPDSTIMTTKPTRDIIMRKEILNWLMSLNLDFEIPDCRDANMYSPYIGQAFNFNIFFREVVGLEFPDIDPLTLSPETVLTIEGTHRYQTSKMILDVLLSGVISFDQFKSLLLPTYKHGSQTAKMKIAYDILSLFEQVKHEEKVQKHPLDTMIFFKSMLEIIYHNANDDVMRQRLKDAFTSFFLQIISWPEFSCKTFCAVFLPKNQNQPSIIDPVRIMSFMHAVQHGILNLSELNRAFERNPKLTLNFGHMNNGFYDAVNKGFIPLSSIINSRYPIGNFYSSTYLAPIDNPHDSDFNHSQELNKFYNHFMTQVINHPDRRTDKLSLIRDAVQFLKLMQALPDDVMARRFSRMEAIEVYENFLTFRQKIQNMYRDIIIRHFDNEAHQQIMLSSQIKDFIFPSSIWRSIWATMYLDEPFSDYNKWLQSLEDHYKDTIGKDYVSHNLLILNNIPAQELAEAAKQVDLLIDNQDPQRLSPALSCLMSLHIEVNNNVIDETYRLFGKLPSLFKQTEFPIDFSLWGLVKSTNQDTMNTILQSLTHSEEIQSIQDEEWMNHMTLLKNELLKIGAHYFGTEAAYKICQSFFNSPEKILSSLLLLALGKWNKDDYIKVVKTFIKMHYDHRCGHIFQYEPDDLSPDQDSYEVRIVNSDLPSRTEEQAFDADIFVDVISRSSLLDALNQTNTPSNKLWNEACHKSNKGEVTQH